MPDLRFSMGNLLVFSKLIMYCDKKLIVQSTATTNQFKQGSKLNFSATCFAESDVKYCTCPRKFQLAQNKSICKVSFKVV